MEFEKEWINEVLVITIPGDTLEADVTHEFKRDIAPLLSGSSKIVFDMSRLQFVDSSGCGALLYCLREIKPGGGELRLCCVHEAVASLFKVIRLERQLKSSETREDALRAFNG